MTSIESLVSHLNPPQKQAVLTVDGPLLLLSGAGSGKTRVLTYRTANLVAGGYASPNEILAVTFTNKAAKEMESRILALMASLGVPIYERMWISTFHSLCVRLLREFIDLLDYSRYFSIYDTADQLSVIKKVLQALQIDEKFHPVKSFQTRINSAKMLGLSAEEAIKKAFFADKLSSDVYIRYEDEMKRSNALDFNDLILKTYQLVRDYPAVLDGLQNRFRYIMVDEYQDTNHIQYLLMKMLAEKHRNFCVVGDEDQSIYSWRGADISNILDFEKDFPEAQVIKLEQNYRSTQTIVTAASHLIRNNSQRKDKTLFTENTKGDLITIHEESSEYDEARFVARTLKALVEDGDKSYSDCAIFYRTNAQSRVLEEQCRLFNIPYKMVGGLRFYDRQEIKDIMAYMKLILNPGDDVAFKRIINVPARGIGKVTIENIEERGIQDRTRMVEAAIATVQQRAIHAGAQKKVSGFLDLLVRLREKAQTLNLKDLYIEVLNDTGYLQALKSEENAEAEARVQNLEELDNAITEFMNERGDEGTLQNFLEEMALLTDLDKSDNQASATLMTLHVSKGLEFPIVFMVGLEENLFPSGQANDSLDPTGLEEERRLCYVGMTRAEERLYMTYARQRRLWGNTQFNPPSRFLAEIPAEFVVMNSAVERPRMFDRMRGAPDMDVSDDSPLIFSNTKSYNFRRGRGVGPRPYADDQHQDDVHSFPEYDYLSESLTQSGSTYSKGQRVKHPTYGLGSIFKVEGSGEQMKVSVLFSDKTVKKFVAKYARLEKI